MALEKKQQISSNEVASILEHYPSIQVLSLDCFDTLLWRLTALPKDIFYELAQHPLYQQSKLTAYQRINAAQLAYRQQFAATGKKEITLKDIYRNFLALTSTEQQALIQVEIETEKKLSFAFKPFVDLIREAIKKKLMVVIVSDTYFTEEELRSLLTAALPDDIMNGVHRIFCSSAYGQSKQTGLFQCVLNELQLSPNSILHIGDHREADYVSAQSNGMMALHFLPCNAKQKEHARLQRMASKLLALNEPSLSQTSQLPCYHPFRAVIANSQLDFDLPENTIGYLSFGPILYVFSKFIVDEIQALKNQGKRPIVFFLLRDAHLLSKACELFAGQPLGKNVRIRKFVAVAASFRTRVDIDRYLSSLTSVYYDFHVICEQLLLPKDIAAQLIQAARQSPHPEKLFNELIHQDDVMAFIFDQSAAYRRRLKKYIQKEMVVKPGDTLVLVDMGYVGTTQTYLSVAIEKELEVEIVGRYLIGSHEPDRPACKSLMTSTACDHGLFEQCATLKEGAVLDYDEEGNPIFDGIRLHDRQYDHVEKIQAACLRFIEEAKHFFNDQPPALSVHQWQLVAMAALWRHVYFPMEDEIHYFKHSQHDKDMGPQLTKTMYNLDQGFQRLRLASAATPLHPYERRAYHLEKAVSQLVQSRFQFDLESDDWQLRKKKIKVMTAQNNQPVEKWISSIPTHDGFFSLSIPASLQEEIAVVFGSDFHWLQLQDIQLLGSPLNDMATFRHHFVFDDMKNHGNYLLECLSIESLLFIKPIPERAVQGFRIIFRPLVERTKTY